MKWYSWLNDNYKQIIFCYKKNKISNRFHALLISSQIGIGEESLCYAIKRWIMCNKPIGINSCNICNSCQLMKNNNHPDIYELSISKARHSIGIDSVRNVINKIYTPSYKGGPKIIWIPHAGSFTDEAANAFLKTIEEPPENTYFLLLCNTSSYLLPTLKSRCIYWPLLPPNKSISILWLTQMGFSNSLSIYTALKICGGSPLAAKDLLIPLRWEKRLILCNTLQRAIDSNNFLLLLPLLHNSYDDDSIYWLLILISDALKCKFNINKFIVNIDQMILINTIAIKCSSTELYIQWKQWIYFLYILRKIKGINVELLISYYLLKWEYTQSHNEKG